MAPYSTRPSPAQQLIMTNLVSDAPLLTISTDNLDDEGLRKPRRWNIGAIARFMVFFGLISSIFNVITTSSLGYLLGAGPALFRTGWFIELALSEIFVTFSVRPRRNFFKPRPSNLMILAAVARALASRGPRDTTISSNKDQKVRYLGIGSTAGIEEEIKEM